MSQNTGVPIKSAPVCKSQKFDYPIYRKILYLISCFNDLNYLRIVKCLLLVFEGMEEALKIYAFSNRIPIVSLKSRNSNAMHLGKKFLATIFSRILNSILLVL